MATKPKKKPAASKREGTAEDAGRPRGSRKMLLAAAFMCLISLGGGFFLARMAFMQDAESFEPEYKADAKDSESSPKESENRDSSHETKSGKVAASEGAVDEDAEALDNSLFDMGEMLTNIQGFDRTGAPTTAFLKVNLMVAYRPESGASALMAERQALIRDLFNGYLRGLTENDLRGMAGILFVKAELLKRARAAVGSDVPQEILIKDLIVQ